MMGTRIEADCTWLEFDLPGARAAVAGAAEAFGRLVEQAPGRQYLPVPGLTWTSYDLIAHVTAGAEGYLQYFDGATDIGYDIADMAGSNQRFMDALGRPDLPELGRRLQAAYRTILARTEGLDALHEVAWHTGPLPLAAVLGTSLNELLVHGADLAGALGAPWEITPDAALHGLRAAVCAAPAVVDMERSSRHPATYRIVVPGLPTSQWVLDSDGLRIRPWEPGMRASCTVRVDPVTFLRVSYGRTSALGAALRGRALSWGRKPWKGLVLASYLQV